MRQNEITGYCSFDSLYTALEYVSTYFTLFRTAVLQDV